MFHPLDGLSVLEQQAANVRQFVGDGTPFLKVPGLKDQPASVRLGHTILPMTITQDFPTAVPGKVETVTSPLYILQFQADGMPVLMRSQQSNDGVWQKDVPVFVQGEWEEAKEGPGVGGQGSEAAEVEALRERLAQMETLLADERDKASAAADAAAKAKADTDAKAAADAAAKGGK